MDIEDMPIMAGTSKSPSGPSAPAPVDTGYSTFRLDQEEDQMLQQWRAARADWKQSVTAVRDRT